KKLEKRKKAAWKDWVDQGKPRSLGNIYWDKYKGEKKSFRREFRKAQQEFENKCQLEIDKMEEISLDQFWCFVKNKKTRTSNPPVIKSDDGNVLMDELEVTNEWRSYFECLMSDHGTDSDMYDKTFFEYVNVSIKRMEIESYKRNDLSFDEPIEFSEMHNMCKKLSKGKAPGWDSINSEHLNMGGPSVIQVLTKLYNHIVYSE
ncbi:unnamed protein product, partial [Owenia fusiformis]